MAFTGILFCWEKGWGRSKLLPSGGRETPRFLLCHLCMYHPRRKKEECFITARQEWKPSVFCSVFDEDESGSMTILCSLAGVGQFLKKFISCQTVFSSSVKRKQAWVGGWGGGACFLCVNVLAFLGYHLPAYIRDERKLRKQNIKSRGPWPSHLLFSTFQSLLAFILY